MDALKSSSSFNNTVAAARSHLRSRPFSSSTISFLRPPSPPAPAAAQKLGSGVSALVNLIVPQHKRSWSISSPCSSLSAESEVQVKTFRSQPEAEYGAKTVRVKFLVKRPCSYGETCLLSGDSPMFGMWDPSNAIPLNWSEGHVWSVELDLPVGKTIQYKFILKCNNGEIKWQPGPDRILQTWETKNAVVISEDWRFARLQKITQVEAESGEKNRSVSQEVGTGSNRAAPPIDRLLEMKDGEVLIPGGETFPKEVPNIVVAKACAGEGDEDPPLVPV